MIKLFMLAMILGVIRGVLAGLMTQVWGAPSA